MHVERNHREMVREISSLKKECARLREADEKFTSLFDGFMDGLVIVDSENGRIIRANNRLGAMLGYEGGALVGEAFDILLPEKSKRSKIDLLKELQVCGGVFTQEFEHRDGHTVLMDLMATLVPWEEDWAILCTLRDAVERVQLERRLRQAQKMEAVGALAGGVAHDLNNILSGLVSYPDLLLMDLPEESRFRKPILTIKRSGERAAAIVHDLLMLARGSLGGEKRLNLNRVILNYEESAEYRRLKNDYPHVRLETRLAEDLFPVSGSLEHLMKAFSNLVQNAALAMPQGGVVKVATEKWQDDGTDENKGFRKPGDYDLLTVSDSGAKMSSEDLDRIFEPFYASKRMGRKDTGLSMTVVWRAVKDHGGHIDVTSAAGAGTTFSVYLPAAENIPLQGTSPGAGHESE